MYNQKPTVFFLTNKSINNPIETLKKYKQFTTKEYINKK